jgi:uncharacterized membrane protein
MNIIIITKTLLEKSNVERRSLRTKIKKYLHQMKIVEDSKTLKLLRQTIVLLTINSSSQMINNRDSKLYDILQRMQTIIKQLQKKIKIRHQNQRTTRTLRNLSSNRTRCQSASKNALRNFSIRKRSNKSKNSRSISSTTKKKKIGKSNYQKHHKKNARRESSRYQFDSKTMR